MKNDLKTDIMNIKDLFMTRLEECYDALSNGCEVTAARIAEVIRTPDELQECLALIKSEQERIQNGIADCDSKIKVWQQSKKAWKARQESLLAALKQTLADLNLKTATDGTVKVTMSSKTGLTVVSPDELLKPYQANLDALRASLPPYIKVSMDLDKTLLASYLKTDDTLLLTQPENLHYEVSSSVRIS